MLIENIENDVLLEAYHKAIEKQLDDDFILILKSELIRRGFDVKKSLNRVDVFANGLPFHNMSIASNGN
ncbi:hypothetical protein JCM19046_2641 [Bacillus sp. JCM 19046]|nr:hypothetical protein JCM19046_2641 [Bacillus sp. JCM 19046]